MHIQYSIAFRLLYGRFRQGHVWTQFHGAREQVPQVQPTNEQPFNGFQWVKGFVLVGYPQATSCYAKWYSCSSMIYHDLPFF
jgi:hypothetical protein